ncbi:hypothetical protein BGZ98_007275 [Dissophora globulifera]|nr:hypothetical protein BGZ98_007275 [Dissophora globulifera]
MTDIEAISSVVAILVASIIASASRVKFNKRICERLGRKCQWLKDLIDTGNLGPLSDPALKALQELLSTCDKDLKKFAGTGLLMRRIRSGGIPEVCELHMTELDDWVTRALDPRFNAKVRQAEPPSTEDEEDEEDELDQEDAMRHDVLVTRNQKDAANVFLSNPTPDRVVNRAIVNSDYLGEDRTQVGSFPFGTIYQGTYKGEPVYIRELNSDLEDEAVQSIKMSIQMAQCLSDCDNIVRIYGFCGTRTIVTDMPANGPLNEYAGKLSNIQKVVIVRKIADALLFMYDIEARDKRIIHRDIRAANVLLTDKMTPMLTGFEVCKGDREVTAFHHTQEEGLRKWRSPETGFDFGTSPESDVYSFGILMYEISTGQEPEEGVDLADIERGRICEEYTALMRKCLQRHSNARPTIDKVVEELYSIESGLGYLDQ